MFAGKAKTPVVIRTMIGAGQRAGAHHSQTLYSMFTHIPGLKCVVPATPYDAKGLLIAAILPGGLMVGPAPRPGAGRGAVGVECETVALRTPSPPDEDTILESAER